MVAVGFALLTRVRSVEFTCLSFTCLSRPLLWEPPKRQSASVGLIPLGVISNAHGKISATGKPKMRTMINTFITHGGASKAGKKIDDA
jgi:hypothetical protein